MSQKYKYSLISERIFTCSYLQGEKTGASLPEVLEALVKNKIISFDALQVHQKQAWYCFLVQLGAIATARNGCENPPEASAKWKELLLELTNGDEAPWCLVVEDVSLPAFMQSPIPEGSLEQAKYKADVATPDDLDVLITAKNHDIKKRRLHNPSLEHWIYALITLQTLEGYLGVGNYGIIRMNGGFGNRPMVGFAPGLEWGKRFTRDVSALIGARSSLIENYGYDPNGTSLVWIEPWDGKKESGLLFNQCDPLFIEICRRIRFVYDAEHDLACRRANSKGSRLTGPDELYGKTGDPWVPVDKSEHKALSLGRNGWTYKLLRDVLFSGDYERPISLQMEEMSKGGGFLIAAGLVRGQGETQGLHNRIVPLSRKAMTLLNDISGREKLAKRSEAYINDAAKSQSNILVPALKKLITAGSDGNKKVDTNKLYKYLEAFRNSVDEAFFQYLWNDIEFPDSEALKRWQTFLYDASRIQYENAVNSSPLPSIRRYRAISRADMVFKGCSARVLDKLFAKDAN